MPYYATPTGEEGSSGTGSKEKPRNLGISLAQFSTDWRIAFNCSRLD